MALHSISEAARLAGKARSTIHRHLADGRLSKTTTPDGSPVIETSELVRAYGSLHPLQPEHDTPTRPVGQAATSASDTRETAHELRQEVDALRCEKVDALERRVAELEAERDAWKDQADAWREQARVALLRLPVPTPPASTSAMPLGGGTPPGNLGLLARLRLAVAGRVVQR